MNFNLNPNTYTEAQMLEYGRAEFARALLLAMQAAQQLGQVGNLVAVLIALKQTEP